MGEISSEFVCFYLLLNHLHVLLIFFIESPVCCFFKYIMKHVNVILLQWSIQSLKLFDIFYASNCLSFRHSKLQYSEWTSIKFLYSFMCIYGGAEKALLPPLSFFKSVSTRIRTRAIGLHREILKYFNDTNYKKWK